MDETQKTVVVAIVCGMILFFLGLMMGYGVGTTDGLKQAQPYIDSAQEQVNLSQAQVDKATVIVDKCTSLAYEVIDQRDACQKQLATVLTK